MANILPSVLIQNSVFWTWSTADSSELGKAHLMLTEKQQALWEDISYSAWAYSTTGSQSVPFLPSYSLWVQNTESIFTIKQILLFTPAPTGFSIKHFHLQRHWWCFPTLSLIPINCLSNVFLTNFLKTDPFKTKLNFSTHRSKYRSHITVPLS